MYNGTLTFCVPTPRSSTCTLSEELSYSYDMITYDVILFAQNRGQKPNYNVHMTEKKAQSRQQQKQNRTISTTINNRKTNPN